MPTIRSGNFYLTPAPWVQRFSSEGAIETNRTADLPHRDHGTREYASTSRSWGLIRPWYCLRSHEHCRTSKTCGLAITGEGHWITGTLVIIAAAYAASLLHVERLFAMHGEPGGKATMTDVVTALLGCFSASVFLAHAYDAYAYASGPNRNSSNHSHKLFSEALDRN